MFSQIDRTLKKVPKSAKEQRRVGHFCPSLRFFNILKIRYSGLCKKMNI